MTRTTLRQLFQRKEGNQMRSVEELHSLINRLTAERQQLRSSHADREVLESNRREIAAAQWELSYALIQRHHPAAA